MKFPGWYVDEPHWWRKSLLLLFVAAFVMGWGYWEATHVWEDLAWEAEMQAKQTLATARGE